MNSYFLNAIATAILPEEWAYRNIDIPIFTPTVTGGKRERTELLTKVTIRFPGVGNLL